MMIYYEFECYVHYRPFVTVEEKPQFQCKCPFKECGLAVYAGTNEIVDSHFVNAPPH